MKRLELLVNGTSYPCYQTAGAMVRFKDLTGKEVTEIKGDSLSDLIKFLYCCVVSACAREKRDFPFTMMEFADGVGNEDFKAWKKAVDEMAKPVEEDEKKSPSE